MYIFDCTPVIGYEDYNQFISSVKESFNKKKLNFLMIII